MGISEKIGAYLQQKKLLLTRKTFLQLLCAIHLKREMNYEIKIQTSKIASTT